MSLEDLEAAGSLLPLRTTRDELARLMASAGRMLADAQVDGVSNQGRYVNAYHVILNCAIAALRVQDYKIDLHEGKHALALETLAFTLGYTPERLRVLQKMRARRNMDLYAGDRPASESEREAAVSLASKVLEDTLAYIRQARLDFRS